VSEQRPKISAIVIVYNGMKFLPDCLDTLSKDLESISHELILVDNASIDGSVDFIKQEYSDAIIIEHSSNLGFAPAVNAGIKQANGKYLYILNQDLRFTIGATAALMDRIKQDDSIGLIGPKFIGFDGKLQFSCRAFPAYRNIFYRLLMLDRLFPRSREFASWRMGWFDHKSECEVDQPMGAAMLIPRKVVDEVGLMDENFPLLFNDVDYCKRISNAGYRLIYYPKAEIEHFVGASTSRLPYALIYISHTSMFRYLRKHSRFGLNPFLWLCGAILYLSIFPKLVLRFVNRTIFSR